ncbi:MAG: hypothetical protein J2P29_00490 [Actinobacteria bacterium]|nr:hypothetical protein [Actinomycetota bacterium]
MGGSHGAGNLTLVGDFRAALQAETMALFLVFVLLAIGWVACRAILLARARPWLMAQRDRWPSEPAWRRAVRIGFGVLWIVDGLLQSQPGMPAGLPSMVIAPAANGSPGWVVHIVTWGAQAWTGEPVAAAAGAVWIQLGIGIWLVSVSSPRWSRLAGLASAGWGLVIWVFAEAFGGILGPHQSWLTGAPGAALFYCVAGGLLMLPVRYWRDTRLGRRILQGIGALLAVSAVVQAWPHDGFWQGTQVGPGSSRSPGPLAAFIGDMAASRQPTPVHDLVVWFGTLVAAHGFAVNMVVVVALAVAAVGLLTGWPQIARPVAGGVAGLCLASWVLVQDFGIFGGLGTDPNSMLPQVVLLTAGLLAESSAVAASTAAAGVSAARPVGLPGVADPAGTAILAGAAGHVAATAAVLNGELEHRSSAILLPGRAARRLGFAFGTASASAVLTIWAIVMVLMGAGPLALAAVHRGAPPPAAVRPAAGVMVRTAACDAAGLPIPQCR